MSYDVRDKTILVTGANRGIGKAIVEAALKHGAAKIASSAEFVGEFDCQTRVSHCWIVVYRSMKPHCNWDQNIPLLFAAKQLGQRAPLGLQGGNGDLWGPWLFGRI